MRNGPRVSWGASTENFQGRAKGDSPTSTAREMTIRESNEKQGHDVASLIQNYQKEVKTKENRTKKKGSRQYGRTRMS